MKLRWLIASTLFAALAIPCVPTCAQQVGIYATLSGDRRHITDVLSTPPAGSDNTKTNWPFGPTIGFYNNFSHAGPIYLGSDARLEFARGSYSSNALLFGLRLAAKPVAVPLKPYIQASLGLVHFNTTDLNASSTNMEYRITGGVDYTLLPHIDWRVIEIGGGSILDYSFGSGTSQGNSLTTYSTGIVFRVR
jgi:hypothetical protein